MGGGGLVGLGPGTRGLSAVRACGVAADDANGGTGAFDPYRSGNAGRCRAERDVACFAVDQVTRNDARCVVYVNISARGVRRVDRIDIDVLVPPNLLRQGGPR
jgi:hypothetical protein